MPKTHKPSLRDEKRARTRIRLVEALMQELAQHRLDEVKVRDLASHAGVSQATVFNYFPTKGHLLTHFIRLWSLQVGVEARRILVAEQSALAALEALFVHTGEQTARNPTLMLEIIAHQARGVPDTGGIEALERRLFLPDEPDVDELSDQGLGDLIPELLSVAVKGGELPKSTDIPSLTLAAASIFFGVPLLLGHRQPEAIAPMYRQHLQLLWAGARTQES